MAAQSAISWTDATFNPWIGCTKVSPGCDNCYAKADFDDRKHRVIWGAGQARSRTKTWGDPVKWNKQPFAECKTCGWRGTDPHEGTPGWVECPLCGNHSLAPARRRVFCASLADVFDNEVPAAWRVDLLRLIESTPNLDWLLLTKRIGNVERLLDEAARLMPEVLVWPMPNVWLGATIVNQEEADRDIPKLLATPARVRFLSMEPLLSEISLRTFICDGSELEWSVYGQRNLCSTCGAWEGEHKPRVDWVIVGGESGHGARPMHPDWVRSLRDQCKAAGLPLHFKQWGEWAPVPYTPERRGWNPASGREHLFQDGPEDQHTLMERVGKKLAGRLLDGVEHNGFPEVRP